MDSKWSPQRYGIIRASVGRLGDLVVSWGRDAYQTTVFGIRLAGQIPDTATAKREAVRAARAILAEASEALDAIETELEVDHG